MPIALRSYWVFIRFLISNNNNLIMTYAHVVTADWLEARTIKYTNFPAKYMNSRSNFIEIYM